MYVEEFVGSHAPDIRGRVLEIAAPDYTTRFGHGVERVDILMATEGNPQATIVGDLTDAPHIPSDAFDCAIVTQTLQFVYDVRAALATLHRVLAPGGVLLATVPGITKISPPEDEQFGEWWHFTARSAQRLAEEAFGAGNVQTRAYGNVLSAAGFLYGLAASDLRRRSSRPRPAVRGDRLCPRREAGARLRSSPRPKRRRGQAPTRCATAELPVRAPGQALLDGLEPLLQLVQPALKPDHIGLSEHRGLDRVLGVLDERRRERAGSAGVVACPRVASGRSASRSRVSTTNRPSATPRSTSSSETTSAS